MWTFEDDCKVAQLNDDNIEKLQMLCKTAIYELWKNGENSNS